MKVLKRILKTLGIFSIVVLSLTLVELFLRYVVNENETILITLGIGVIVGILWFIYANISFMEDENKKLK